MTDCVICGRECEGGAKAPTSARNGEAMKRVPATRSGADDKPEGYGMACPSHADEAEQQALSRLSTRPYSSDELAGLVMLDLLCAGMEDASSKLARRMTASERESVMAAVAKARQALKTLLDRLPDDDTRVMTVRKMQTLRLVVSHVNHVPKDLIVLDVQDATTLIGHALDFCAYQCPYEDIADNAYDQRGAHKCYLAKLYKRCGLAEKGISAKCKYWGI